MAQLEYLASLLSEDDSIYDSFLTDYALDEIDGDLERSKFYINCNYILFLTVGKGRYKRSIVVKFLENIILIYLLVIKIRIMY